MRLAYFGSDTFSILCLKRLLPLNSNFLLDIVTRHPKPSGRGLLSLKDLPIADFANRNNINLLRVDSKAEFEAIKGKHDLCIAVSYGKLIPSTFLSSLTYGGLNVHPSLLPKYSGPAPLHRALLNNDSITGVSVQTLHPTEFDKGDVLAREEYTIKENETLDSLTETLAIMGGDLLNNIVKKSLFDKSNPNYRVLKPDLPFSYAAKVSSTDNQIIWKNATVQSIMRKYGVLHKLHTFKPCIPKKKSTATTKRVVLGNIQPSSSPLDSSLPNGSFRLLDDSTLEIKVSDGFIKVDELKTEGFGSDTPAKFISSLKKKFNNTDNYFI